jgi:hypothetical protein
MTDRHKRAQHAPPSRPLPGVGELQAKLSAVLTSFSLTLLNPFSVIVEGTTDVDYLYRAAELHLSSTGVDLLLVPEGLAVEAGERIGIYTPGKPGAPNRGGVPQVTRLARELAPFYFMLEAFAGLQFVFDHDDAGVDALQQIEKWGYKPEIHGFSLDPKNHPACGEKQVVIEDLLSLKIQEQFFALGTAWCSVDYEAGRLSRFHWGFRSKPELRNFVCTEGGVEDLGGVTSILKRIRERFRFVD